MHRLLLSVCLVGAAVPAYAQSEAALKDYFEGKSVVVKMDMPATQEGIDLYPDARRPVDFNQYSQRLKSYGVAIRNGESVMITKVHVKDKLIEFQLAGGGFGTFGDDTGSVYVSSTPKSKREKELEDLVKNEDDSVRKRRLQRELDELRDDRRREDDRKKAAAETANEAKKARIATERLHSGSRFNIRYQNGVPSGLGPDGVMRALADYLEFPFAGDRRPEPAAPRPRFDVPDARPAARTSSPAIRKGMTMAEVESALGRADSMSDRSEGSLKVTTAIFSRDDQRISAEFVEGVMIRYSISSK